MFYAGLRLPRHHPFQSDDVDGRVHPTIMMVDMASNYLGMTVTAPLGVHVCN